MAQNRIDIGNEWVLNNERLKAPFYVAYQHSGGPLELAPCINYTVAKEFMEDERECGAMHSTVVSDRKVKDIDQDAYNHSEVYK